MSTHKTAKLKPGEMVAGRYRIDGVVGRGGFGAVYRATQIDTGTPVALKILLKNFTSAKTDFKRFQREASLVQKLRHPNVVELLDFGQTEKGQPYIAFELLKGRALGRVLKHIGALPLFRAAQVAREILAALDAAHQLGVIHRDIKPQNIFLCDDDAAKVLDFGIAKAVEGEDSNATQLTEAGQMIGTPQYMAPEQVRGTGIEPATDLYAAGLVLSEMISGERVVKGNALIDVYMQHISPSALEHPAIVMRSPLAAVVTRATNKVLEQRYASAAEMLADLDRAVPRIEAEQERIGGTTELVARGDAERLVASLSDGRDTDKTKLRPQSHPAHGAAAAPDDPHGSTVVMTSPDAIAQARAIMGDVMAHVEGPDSEPAPGSSIDQTVDMPPDQSSLASGLSQLPASSAQPQQAPWSAPPDSPLQALQPSSVQPHAHQPHPHRPHAHQPHSSQHPHPSQQPQPSHYPQSLQPRAHTPAVASGEHVFPSGEHAYASGEHAYASGEHAYTSGEHGHAAVIEPIADELTEYGTDQTGRRIALIVLLLALVAGGILLFLWAPWEDASYQLVRPDLSLATARITDASLFIAPIS